MSFGVSSMTLAKSSGNKFILVSSNRLRIVWILSRQTKKEFGETIGVSMSTIHRWLNKPNISAFMTAKQFEAVCDNYGCSPDYLLGESNRYGKNGETEKEIVPSSKCSPLRYLRLKNRIKQTELEVKVPVTQATIGYYERGERKMPEDMAKIFADFFGVTPEFILDWRPENEN